MRNGHLGAMTAITYAICAAVWGTTWFAIRVCIAPGGYPPYAAAALRFSLASVILGGLWLAGVARPGPRRRRDVAWMVAAGLCNGGSYALVYTAEGALPGGLVAVLFGTFPLVTAALAGITRTERIARASLVGAAVSAAGIAVVFYDQLDLSADRAAAVALALGAVVLSAGYSVIMKRHTAGQHPLAATGVFVAITAAVLWLASAALDDRGIPAAPAASATVALVYLGVVGSVVVFASYFALLKRASLMTVSTLVFIQPLIALAVDAVWERSAPTGVRAYAGAAIVLAGVAISVLPGAARSRAARAAARAG
ncbi:MAG: hypothetical protein D6689_02755 [Deltaproteobacteria bacterium]|nr:MAG: hypothetical protein D6689_02755 [Deltaproteobacteria bacterium]